LIDFAPAGSRALKFAERRRFPDTGPVYSPRRIRDEAMENLPKVAKAGDGTCTIKEIVQIIARALVDQPDAVSVSEISGANSLIIELKVAREDLGKVIGKQGRNAGAMRIIVNAASAKTRRHTVLEIIE
jgi:predicted RNA-binding protein YlqC (UPF0109 family)